MNRHQRRAQKRFQNKAENGLRWVCNDYSEPSVDRMIPKFEDEDLHQALEEHMHWRSQFSIGLPMKTKMLSVNELLEAGIVGLYTDDLKRFEK